MDQNNPDYSFDVAKFVLFQYKSIFGNPTFVDKAYPMNGNDFVNINYDNPVSNTKGTVFIPMTAYLHWQQIYYQNLKEAFENAIN